VEEYGGWTKVSGVVRDHEAVCDATVRILQEAHPHIIDICCQAHGEWRRCGCGCGTAGRGVH
jgi:hypothetical protein